MKFNTKGFTLIEIVAVLIILSTLAALAIPRFIDLDNNAKDKAIDSGISELNGRESLIWADTKVSSGGWQDDATLFATMDTYLGGDYAWVVAPTTTGGRLSFQAGSPVDLVRSASSLLAPAKWSRL